MERRSWGWKRDLPDVRDKLSTAGMIRRALPLPRKFNLISSFPDPYDQLELGSCTAQAVCSICDFKYARPFDPSRLFLYYATRKIEGTINFDSGASIRNTIKALNKYGTCSESVWPYNPEHFRTNPGAVSAAEAKQHQALQYAKVLVTVSSLKDSIVRQSPVVFGFSVYQNFYDLNSSDYTLKHPKSDDSLLGGHAVVAVGYDDDSKCFIIRNSWGKSWADGGYFLMPYTFITNPDLCSDFWTVELMENQ